MTSVCAPVDTVADTSSEEEVLIVTQDGEEVTATLHDGRLDLHALEKKLVKEGWWLSLLDGRIPSCDRNGLSRSKFKAGAVVHVEIKKKKGESKCAKPCKIFSQHTLQSICKNRLAEHSP